MGCTSSAPSMADCQTSTTDNLENNTTRSEVSEEKTKGRGVTGNSNGHNALDVTQALPVCEASNNQTQLDNNKTPPVLNNIKSNLDITKDDPDISTRETESNTVNNEPSHFDEKYICLKHVVEKVIIDTTTEEEKKVNEEEHDNINIDRYNEDVETEFDVVQETESREINNEDAKESGSPTQSEESRATRWEALADIAAELPPSLAVDPITGQIYSLSK